MKGTAVTDSTTPVPGRIAATGCTAPPGRVVAAEETTGTPVPEVTGALLEVTGAVGAGSL
jgi:hypothetical protein